MRRKTLEVLAEAAAELNEATDWYGERDDTVASTFVTEVRRALAAIVEAPNRSPRYEGSEKAGSRIPVRCHLPRRDISDRHRGCGSHQHFYLHALTRASLETFSKAQEELVLRRFGATPVSRWKIAEQLYAKRGLRAQFTLYPGAAHSVTPEMEKDVTQFFERACRK